MAKKQNRSRVLILGLGIVTALIILLWQIKGKDSELVWLKQKIMPSSTVQQKQKTIIAIAPLKIEQKIELQPAVKDEVKDLNDKGVDLVLQQQYWPAIFLFKQAMELDRSRIEPVVNMAATLDEIGLSLPAARYLAMAEAMDPNYSLLRINHLKRQDKIQSASPKQSPEFPK
jgi:tetratricopeptide (TPR) repeat protein